MKHLQTSLTESIAAAPQVLYLAFELGVKTWRLRFGDGARHCERTIEAAAMEQLWQELGEVKQRWAMAVNG